MKRLFTIAAAGLLCLSAVPEKTRPRTGHDPYHQWRRPPGSLVQGGVARRQVPDGTTRVRGRAGQRRHRQGRVGREHQAYRRRPDRGRSWLPAGPARRLREQGAVRGRPRLLERRCLDHAQPPRLPAHRGQEVQSYGDLEGKTIAVGAKNSGDDARAIEILAAHGITQDNATFQYLGRSDAQEALANRQIDALLIAYSRNNRGHLGPLFAARELGSDLHFVDMDPAMAEKLATQNPAMHVDTLGEPVFDAPDLVSLGVHTGFMLSKSVDEDLVYRMTKLMFENWDALTESAPWWKDEGVGPQKAAAFTATGYHAGAQRYYEEAGLWDTHRQ
ncbi:MAG: TAXI family TRAP transporter solute-binding subunit [Gammaproteobacteria bacterium]|nr:TAXI family TRAP transporter solute-binding subunit [Gammaproteobacteria bacterium]